MADFDGHECDAPMTGASVAQPSREDEPLESSNPRGIAQAEDPPCAVSPLSPNVFAPALPAESTSRREVDVEERRRYIGGHDDEEDEPVARFDRGVSPAAHDSTPPASPLQPVGAPYSFVVGETLEAVRKFVRVDCIPPTIDEGDEMCNVPVALRGMFVLIPVEGSSAGGRVPFSSAKPSALLSALAADSDTSAERCYPVPTLGFAVEVLELVAAYVCFFGSPQAVAPSDPPTPFDRPTFRGKCVFENELFSRLSEDLPLALGVVNAAKFIGCLPLVKLCALSIAQRMRGRTPQQIAHLFEGVQLPMASS